MEEWEIRTLEEVIETEKARRVKGRELIFISKILPDGSGTEEVVDQELYSEKTFELSRLSVTRGTFIAREMGSFVVQRKQA